jgi:hypothetical protein
MLKIVDRNICSLIIQTDRRTSLLINAWQTVSKSTQLLKYVVQEDTTFNNYRVEHFKFGAQVRDIIRMGDYAGTYIIGCYIECNGLRSDDYNQTESVLTESEVDSLKFVCSRRKRYRPIRSERRTMALIKELHQYLGRLQRVLEKRIYRGVVDTGSS